MKKFLKIIIGIIVLVVALLIVIPLLLKGKLAETIKSEADKTLNVKLDFEDIGISLLRHFPKATIELKDVALIGKGTFEGDTLATIDKVAAAINLRSLWGKSGYEISYLTLNHPTVTVFIPEEREGHATRNWQKSPITQIWGQSTLIKERDKNTFHLLLRRLNIMDADIAYADSARNLSLSIEKMNLILTSKFNRKEPILQCNASIQEISFIAHKVTLLEKAEMGLNMDLIVDLDHRNKITFGKNKLHVNAMEMNFDGWLSLLEEGGLEMDLSLFSPEIHLKDILSMIPVIYHNNFDNLQTSGQVSLEAKAKGRLDEQQTPSFAIVLQVDSANVSYTGMPTSIENIDISLQIINNGTDLDSTTFAINPFKFTFAGNPFSMTLQASQPISNLHFLATADGTIDLGEIGRFYPIDSTISINGLITTDLSFNGYMSDIEKENYQNIKSNGTFSIKGMKLNVGDIPSIVVSEATVQVAPKELILDRFNVTSGKSDLQVKGKIANYLPYLAKGETLQGSLSLTSSLLDCNECMGGMDETTKKDTLFSAFIVPLKLNLSLQANLNRIYLGNMILRNFRGKIGLDQGRAVLHDFSTEALGGKISANGLYDTAISPLSPQITFTLNIQDASFKETFRQLDFIQKFVPLFENTEGTYSISTNLNSRLDTQMSLIPETLTAKGSIQSSGIKIHDVEVFSQLANLLNNDKLRQIETQDVHVSFSIADGRVKTSPFDLKIGNTKLTLSGTTGLDQTIDYSAIIDLSQEKIVENYIGKVKADIGGTFSQPQINIDTQSILSQIINNNLFESIIGVGTIEEQITNLRQKAEDAGKELVETAEREGEKLVEKASNPLTKTAAQIAKAKLVEEAKKQADKLADEAERLIRQLKNE